MVTCVSDLIGLDTEQTQIVERRILEFLLLLGWVCVIEPNDDFSIKGGVCEVIIEKSRLRMTDTKVPSVSIGFYISTLYGVQVSFPTLGGSGGNLVTTPLSVSLRPML